MSWVDGWGALARDDSTPLIQGGVGTIGAVLRVDIKKVVAVHARPFDPSAGDEVDVFMSTVPYMSFPTDTPASTRFLDVLRRGYDFEASLFAGGEEGEIGARSLPSVGAGLIDNSDDKQDIFQKFEWGGRSWRVFVGEQEKQFASFVEVWPGRAGRNVEIGRNIIEVPLEDVAKRFDQPVQQNTFMPGFEPYVEFDGIDDEIAFGDVLNRGTASFNWGVAFRTTADQQARLYFKGTGVGSGAGAGYVIGLLTGGQVMAKVADGTDIARPVATVTYDDGQRHVLHARLDRTANTLDLFFDGIQVASADASLVGDIANTGILTAGSAATRQEFTGEIERIAAQQTAFIGNVRGFLDEPFPEDFDTSVFGTAAHAVPLTENVGTSVADLGAGAFDGTIQGGVDAKWSGLRNGRRELEGERIPLAYGDLSGELVSLAGEPDVRRMRIEPVLIDEIKQVWKWHEFSSQALRSAEDGGGALTEELFTGKDFWTDEDGPTAGNFWVNLTDSLIRLGAAPALKLTISVLGDNSPAFEDEPHRILRRIAGIHVGIPEPAGFEDAAFNALDGVARAGIYIRDENIDETFDWLMRSVQGWWSIGRTGLLTVDQLKVPVTPIATIRDDEIAESTRRRTAVPAVHWRDRIKFGRNWAVQAPGDLIGTLSSARRDIFVRETIVVQDMDAALKTQFLRASDVTLDSLLIARFEAENEILSLTRNLFAVRREVWDIRLLTRILAFWLGDVIEFGPDVTRFDLAGRRFVVIGIKETITEGTTLTLWG